MQVLEQEPVSPRTLNPKVPQDLETICLKCLDKDRHRRYASAKDLADELQRFINGEPILARPISTTARAWRWCKRKPALAITGALMVVATLAALLILVIAVVLVSASRQEAWTLAEANERLAKEELGLRKQAERDFVSLLFEQSHAQCRAEDAAEGILWLARSLEAAAKAETPDLEKAIRTQLAAWSPCVHPLKAVFRHPAPPGIIHQPSIDIVSFSPNGRILLTGNGAEVALWDSTTGTPIAPTLESPHLVDAAAFHPDGAVVATVGGGTTDGSSDGQMQLWTVETGKPKGPPCKHRGHVHSVAFSPDGKTVATASHTSHAPGAAELRLWESDTGKPMGPPLKHTGKITIIVFSPDGKFVLTGSGGVAQLWDVATGQHAIPPCKRDIFPVLCAAFGPNGKTIWTVDGFGAQRWDTATGQPMGEPIKLDVVDGVVLAPDAQKVLTYRSFSAQLLDLSTRKAIGPPLKHQKPIKAVAFSPDGKIAVTAGEDFTARLWDAASGKALGSPLKHRGGVQAVAISPDGTKVLTGGPESTARLWETPAARSTEQTLKRRSQIQAITASANHMSIGARVSFSSDRKSALTGSGNEARVWDVETGKVVAPVLGHQAKVQAVALSPDGKTALTICQNSTTRLWETRFWNVQTGKLLDSPVEHQERPRGIVFSPDGKTVATAWGLMGDAEARLWDVGTQRPVGSPLENQGTPIVFSPDGKIVATSDCTMDRYTGVRLWDVTTAEPIVPPLNHQGTIRAVAFSPDGQIVLTASVDNTARLWSVATGEPLLPALKHADDVGAVTLSPDGQLVLTGSGGAARLWETRTGEPVGPPFVHGGGVGVVAFSRDGNYVLTHGVNGARLWDLETRRTIGPALERESSITGDNLQMLLTVTPFDMVRLWNMREVMDSQAERLVLWTQVVTGMELDPNGGALVLDASAWNERSERLEELGREAVARQP
ncbi:MAG: hypothetical protein H8E44_45960, partial [Planctomycetes bacterium]|nr:hypothetical protein [Planctomycetota bacterium]